MTACKIVARALQTICIYNLGMIAFDLRILFLEITTTTTAET